jgi:hypothetical protein
MPEHERTKLGRELLIGTAAFFIAIAAVCILAAQAPPRRRRDADADTRLADELVTARRRVDELAEAERSLEAEVEDACEVATVALETPELVHVHHHHPTPEASLRAEQEQRVRGLRTARGDELQEHEDPPAA